MPLRAADGGLPVTKLVANDEVTEALGALIAEAALDTIRIWVLKRMMTRFTKFDVTWKEAYALSFLARGVGTWFEQGCEHAATTREKTTV